MALQFNSVAFLRDEIGMPEAHKNAFLQVARDQKCVIMSRATGPTCLGPLTEGYDTKGYRIHGKSCDWGPMAGFVMRDPRLNKAGMKKEGFNTRKHKEALYDDHESQGWKAATTPLVISSDRVNWLRTTNRISVILQANGRLDGVANHPSGINFKYCLIPHDGNMFGVYFDHTENIFSQRRASNEAFYKYIYGNRYEAMLALTNPETHRLSATKSYLNAITGDYDLFAIWPFVKNYNASPGGDDERPLGTTRGLAGTEGSRIDHRERHFTNHDQGTKLGNITNRIYMVCQMINSRVGRHVTWHSDESARPYLDDVDLPVIAFTPAGNAIGITSIFDFKVFIRYAESAGINVTLSNAWTLNPEPGKARLGADYERFVPNDGQRYIVPQWFNN